MNIFRQYFASLGISRQIILINVLIYVVVVGLNVTVFRGIYTDLVLERMAQMSRQSLYLVTEQVEGTLDMVEGYAGLIGTDDSVQEVLEKTGDRNLEMMNDARGLLSRTVASSPLLISAFLYDPESYVLGVNPGQLRERFQLDTPEFEWFGRFGEVERDSIHYARYNKDRSYGTWVPYVSCVRIIRSNSNGRILGYILLNYDISPIRRNVSLPGLPEPHIVLFNEYNQTIASTNWSQEDLSTAMNPGELLSSLSVMDEGNHSASFMEMENGWTAGIITSRDQIAEELPVLGRLSILVILLASTLMLLGQLFITRLLVHPLRSLTAAFSEVENGVPPMVSFPSWNRDIALLRDGYNQMVEKMKLILEDAVKVEREKNLNDLRLFQAQVKPHFLYNTFDTICALALKGDTDSVYHGMLALGKFYRTTLSAGLDLIPLVQEIESIRNYMLIQKLRYDELVEDSYDIPVSLEKYPIPKLILQPLVENALYHGLMPLGETGTISLCACLKDSRLVVEVTDNGVGFSGISRDGFGLHSTRERLRLFFGEEDLFEIKTSEGCGTTIVLTIPEQRSLL